MGIADGKGKKRGEGFFAECQGILGSSNISWGPRTIEAKLGCEEPLRFELHLNFGW